MPSKRLVRLALVGESALALVALAWMWMRGLSVVLGPIGLGVTVGIATAVGFAIINYCLLRLAPPVRPVQSIRRLYRSMLRPLFAEVGPADVLVVSVAAGVGEELLFRGVVQQEFGLVPTSLLFGAMHLGGSGTLAFGCWTAVLGLGLGWVAIDTGGLLAPTIAHVLYDAMAIAYVRVAREPAECDAR